MRPALGEVAVAFGIQLRSRRLSARFSQQELAERSGLSVRAVSDLECGRTRFPYRDSLVRLADALGLRDPVRTTFIAAAGRRSAAAGPSRRKHDPAVAIEELAQAQHVQAVRDPRGELGADIWPSAAELDAFLADLRSARNVVAA